MSWLPYPAGKGFIPNSVPPVHKCFGAYLLSNDPPIILADEPTGELDTRTGTGIVDLLVAINQKYNKTIVVVSHDPEIAQRAERTIEIRDGVVVDVLY
ncbi:MAG: hypothetical protein J7J03_07970 [Methanosarcinales archaeon]|nr:hypothetical protein [Methanosarcinales archaeon]